MKIDIATLVLSLLAAILSGMGTAIIAGIKDSKKEKVRRQERDQDHLKMEIKDLKIQLYELEKQLTEWKDKYYHAIQQLIEVKSELEQTLIQLDHINIHVEEQSSNQ
jgi:septal ring factor EnvC (AmiA/AmiB activator)